MSAWETVALSDACEIHVGRTPARANAEYWGGEHPWLSIADMNQGTWIDRTKESLSDLGVGERAPVKKGTVLLSFKLSIGKVARARIPLYTNEAIAALPVKPGVQLLEAFLARQLEAFNFTSSANRAAMGATFNKRMLGALKIRIPGLTEQRRIASLLDEADAIRTKRRAQLTHLDELPKALFHKMFGDLHSKAVVSDVIAPHKGAARTGPFGSQLLHEEFVDSGIAVLGIDDVVTNTFRWAKRRYITELKYNDLKRYTVHPGDVLITIMGTVGRCAVVPSGIETAINTKHICALTLDHSQVAPEFVRGAFLWHPESRRYLTSRTKGAIMGGLNMSIIKSMPIPLPSLAAQQAFTEKLVSIRVERDRVARALDADDELFAALQHRAFRGEL